MYLIKECLGTLFFFTIPLLFLYPFPSLAQKNAILLIGDGMGPNVISTTRLYFKGADKYLFLDKAPYQGKLSTYSKDRIVTDSAASATAMATGELVNNGVLSLAPPHTKGTSGITRGKKIKTILEMAAERGLSTGVITTVQFTHATPAAFYAHVHNRRNTSKIIDDLKESPVDIILGGGLTEEGRKKLSPKFHIVTDMDKLKCNLKKPLLGGFFNKEFPFIGDVENKEPRKGALKKLVKFTIDCLSKNKKGYFLIVESGRIDQALHNRNICNALYETKEFNDLAQFVVNRVQTKDTLVLATADHDTGGLSVNGPLFREDKLFTHSPCWKGKVKTTMKNRKYTQRYEVLRLSTDGLHPEFMHSNDFVKGKPFVKSAHTAGDVDIFGWGPGAEKVRGIHQNSYVFTLLKEAINL